MVSLLSKDKSLFSLKGRKTNKHFTGPFLKLLLVNRGHGMDKTKMSTSCEMRLKQAVLQVQGSIALYPGNGIVKKKKKGTVGFDEPTWLLRVLHITTIIICRNV